MEIGEVETVTTYVQSQDLDVANPYLHQWLNGSGAMGLSYCTLSGNCPYTPFQELLGASTEDSVVNQTFGLDFRNPNSNISSISSNISSIQLGGAKPEFNESLNWLSQPTPSTVVYHQFFLKDLQFCGTALLANISRNWPVLIDTGSSCLTLPEEIYDHIAGWFGNDTEVSSLQQLPALRFQMNLAVGMAAQDLFIPLATLIVNANAIVSEEGAPFVKVLGSSERLRVCVLKGSAIGNPYNYPAPTIVFGSLVLQSMYFAADFTTASVGLTNKLSADETLFYSDDSNPSCAAPRQCVGDQTYTPSKNACKEPNCKEYFFMDLDAVEHKCIYRSTPYYFGIIFISIIAAAEVASYFLTQYTAYGLLDPRRQQAKLYNIGYFTIIIGRGLSYCVDWMFQTRSTRPVTAENMEL